MKLLFFLALATLVLAAEQQLSTVIISYPVDTATSAIGQDMQDIVDAGGVIGHSFHRFRGFAARAPPDSLRSLSTLSSQYQPIIEDYNGVTGCVDEEENHASMNKRQYIQLPLDRPKFWVGDWVYLWVCGFRDGPFEIDSVPSKWSYTLSHENGTPVRNGKEIDVAFLETA